MRRVLEEELGDSILQQFLNLETEHEVLQARLNEERHELGTERALRSSLEEQLADMQVQLKEAQEHAATMDSAARRAISAKHKEEATVKDLREELERLMRNSPEVLRRRTAQAEAEVERIRAETEKITEKHKKDMLARALRLKSANRSPQGTQPSPLPASHEPIASLQKEKIRCRWCLQR